jgi:hypothetical protein
MMRVASRRPLESEYGPTDYYAKTIAEVSGDDVMPILRDQLFWLCELGSAISAEQTDRVHPPYQWTIRQVFEHCADAERVFGYRAMRIAAGDTTELPGWDENAYASARFGLGGTLSMVIEEWGALRRSNYILLRRIEPKAWDRSARANGVSITVRAIAWLMAAHLQHHFQIIEQRIGMRVQRKPM